MTTQICREYLPFENCWLEVDSPQRCERKFHFTAFYASSYFVIFAHLPAIVISTYIGLQALRLISIFSLYFICRSVLCPSFFCYNNHLSFSIFFNYFLYLSFWTMWEWVLRTSIATCRSFVLLFSPELLKGNLIPSSSHPRIFETSCNSGSSNREGSHEQFGIHGFLRQSGLGESLFLTGKQLELPVLGT